MPLGTTQLKAAFTLLSACHFLQHSWVSSARLRYGTDSSSWAMPTCWYDGCQGLTGNSVMECSRKG